MSERTVLDNLKHRKLKASKSIDLSFLKESYLVPLTIHEFVAAATEHAIFFVKNESTGGFQAVALLGTEPGENLFSKGEQWGGLFIPKALKYAPYSLARADGAKDEFIVMIDESSSVFSYDRGESLFNESGDRTERLDSLVNDLLQNSDEVAITQEFTRMLLELKLLVQKSIALSIAGHENRNIHGVYMVDEAKLDQLSDDDFRVLRARGALPIIYAQLSSMHQTLRLSSLKKLSLERDE